MAAPSLATRMLSQEARALLTRLERVKPFALSETMVAAAAPSVQARAAIDGYLDRQRRALSAELHRYLAWLQAAEGPRVTPAEAQQRLTFLRLRFNVALAHFDLFSEAFGQRSETDTGVWLAGLDALARDALEVAGCPPPPPVLCHLVRGPGAAIRRARTRLPGGGHNPVALISIPRERMIGSGIASSLVHEVGHQGAALLDLVPPLRRAVQALPARGARARAVRDLWARWISEILADFWAVARLGVTASTGLMGVVSLPRPFVFRMSADGPHPIPWIRVKLSLAMGAALCPDAQWERLSRLWEHLYPLAGLHPDEHRVLAALEADLPRLVALLLDHRPAALGGRTLARSLDAHAHPPARLRALHRHWRGRREPLRGARPTLAFAVIGQARADGTLSPEQESHLLAELLKHWALRGALEASERCAALGPTHTRLPGLEEDHG
jgi:hypothetical protein